MDRAFRSETDLWSLSLSSLTVLSSAVILSSVVLWAWVHFCVIFWQSGMFLLFESTVYFTESNTFPSEFILVSKDCMSFLTHFTSSSSCSTCDFIVFRELCISWMDVIYIQLLWVLLLESRSYVLYLSDWWSFALKIKNWGQGYVLLGFIVDNGMTLRQEFSCISHGHLHILMLNIQSSLMYNTTCTRQHTHGSWTLNSRVHERLQSLVGYT